MLIMLIKKQSDLKDHLSKLPNWFQKSLRCDEMAIGDVHFDGGSTFISIHTSKVGLALKALDKHEMSGQKVVGTVAE